MSINVPKVMMALIVELDADENPDLNDRAVAARQLVMELLKADRAFDMTREVYAATINTPTTSYRQRRKAMDNVDLAAKRRQQILLRFA